MTSVRRIGVLTGGGDAPGLNAVIRAIVRACKVEHGVSVMGISDGFIGLVEMKARELGLADVSGLLVRGGTILGTSNRGNPFRYAYRRPDGAEELVDASATAKKNFDKLGLDCLIVIGGDGSLSIAERFWREFGIPVVGVPKTIDNDLSATEYTFGFATALEVATSALDRLHTTAESHHRVMLLEVMGRDSGWIALHAGLAGGGDVVLIPEIPFKFEALLAKFRARERRGRPFSLVVVAEGAAPVGGAQVFAGEDARSWRFTRYQPTFTWKAPGLPPLPAIAPVRAQNPDERTRVSIAETLFRFSWLTASDFWPFSSARSTSADC